MVFYCIHETLIHIGNEVVQVVVARTVTQGVQEREHTKAGIDGRMRAWGLG